MSEPLPDSRLLVLRRAVLPLASLAGGVSLAVVPAATLAIASAVFPLEQQGLIAVAVTTATYAGQLGSAVLVEARLSGVGHRRVSSPVWLTILAIVAASVIAIWPTEWLAVALALPVLLTALEVGRAASVAERRDGRELIAAVLVGGGAAIGVVAALLGARWGFVPLAIGAALAAASRWERRSPTGTGPGLRTTGWIVTDVAVTGVIYPLMNAAVLAALGPTAAVLFTAVSTVSGLLAIPLNFMRFRLLKAHSGFDVALSSVALATSIVALISAHLLGVFALLFGDAWAQGDPLMPLLVACLWRSLSLVTTIPFAALRRAGRVALLAMLRGACAAVTLAITVAVLPSDELTLVFAALAVGELIQAVTYLTARRRVERTQVA